MREEQKQNKQHLPGTQIWSKFKVLHGPCPHSTEDRAPPSIQRPGSPQSPPPPPHPCTLARCAFVSLGLNASSARGSAFTPSLHTGGEGQEWFVRGQGWLVQGQGWLVQGRGW